MRSALAGIPSFTNAWRIFSAIGRMQHDRWLERSRRSVRFSIRRFVRISFGMLQPVTVLAMALHWRLKLSSSSL